MWPKASMLCLVWLSLPKGTLEDIIDKEDQALAVVRWMFMYMCPFQMRRMQGRSREIYPSASGQD